MKEPTQAQAENPLRSIRKSRKIYRRDAARAVGISESAMYRIECAENAATMPMAVFIALDRLYNFTSTEKIQLFGEKAIKRLDPELQGDEEEEAGGEEENRPYHDWIKTPILTTKEAAAYLRMSSTRFMKLVHRKYKAVPAVRFPDTTSLRFTRPMLDRYIESCCTIDTDDDRFIPEAETKKVHL